MVALLAAVQMAFPVRADDHGAKEAGRYESKFFGPVISLPQDRIGIWVVGSRQIVVTKETWIKEKHGRAEPGAYVEVEGNNAGTTFTATEISVKRARQE